MTHMILPSRDVLKRHARRLRDTLTRAGTSISHAAALEHLAHQWGFRDWNTLADASHRAAVRRWSLGQRVSGKYLGHAFTGTVKSVRQAGVNHIRLTIRFDTPVDVVASSQFSSLRRQISCTIGPEGQTIEKTSNGHPHLALSLI